MTQEISRRKLVAGTAWAAPAVLASTVVPVYAASGGSECQSFEHRITAATPYQEIEVPAGATHINFRISGGNGGGLSDYDIEKMFGRVGHIISRGGRGAVMYGFAPVSPGQIVKVHIGLAGQAFYNKPAEGGTGYGKGGSSNIPPSSVIPADVQAKIDALSSDHKVVYSGSGGGSSAVLLGEPGDSSHDTLLVVVGGGSGGGARAVITDSRNPANYDGYDFSNQWDSSGHANEGMDATEGSAWAEQHYEIFFEAEIPDYRFSSSYFPYPTGNSGSSYGPGAAVVPSPIPDKFANITFKSTSATTIRTDIVSGTAGSEGAQGNGADGVAAYGYATAARLKNDPDDGVEHPHFVSGYIVSGGGGAGYNSGGSGASLALGYEVHKIGSPGEDASHVSMRLTSGAGGSGASFSSPLMGESSWHYNHYVYGDLYTVKDGWFEYDFCTSEPAEGPIIPA